MLSLDVNFLARILASHLDHCLPSIISSDQTGFIRGRHLSSNIRSLLNAILSKSNTNYAEMVILVDAEKAFDRVEWDYLFSVRKSEKLKFGSTLR